MTAAPFPLSGCCSAMRMLPHHWGFRQNSIPRVSVLCMSSRVISTCWIFLTHRSDASPRRRRKRRLRTSHPMAARWHMCGHITSMWFDLETNTEEALTSDGSETILNGTLSWLYWEEIYGRREMGYFWSPDSRAIAFYRFDEASVSKQYYVSTRPWTSTLTHATLSKGGRSPSGGVGEDPRAGQGNGHARLHSMIRPSRMSSASAGPPMARAWPSGP